MDQLFTWPTIWLALGCSIAVLVLLGALALAARRNPLLLKLAVRNVPRRKLRAVLIVFGLMLSTTVIGSSFGTGDVIAQTLRSLIVGSLGTVDEIIVAKPPRAGVKDRLRAITEPGFAGMAAARLPFFSEEELARVASAARESNAIAGILPAILDQVTVAHGTSRQLRSSLPLLAVTPPSAADEQQAFGRFETLDGTPIALEALGPNEVLINAAAAEIFGAVSGELFRIIHRGQSWDVHIAAISKNAGLAGDTPLVIVPLDHYQTFIGHGGKINALLVANHGGHASVALSEQATRELRNLLADRDAAEQIYAILNRPDVQRGLIQFEGLLKGRSRERIAALRAEAAHPEITDRFVSLISEPRTHQILSVLAGRLPERGDRINLSRLLQRLSDLSVLEIKQEALSRAAEYGAAVTTIFLVVGIISIAAAILLIFLIFALLAADRGADLAMMRALGMRRGQIMLLFLFEGVVYNVLGAALGTLAGLGTTILMSSIIARQFELVGLRLDRDIEPVSLVLAFTSGVLLTLSTMAIAAWRVSHSQIIAATHGEARDEGSRWLAFPGLLAILAAGLIWSRWHTTPTAYEPRHPLVLPMTLSLILAGAACCLLTLRRPHMQQRAASILSGSMTLLGIAAAAVWLWTLEQLPTPRGVLQADALTSVLGVLVLIPLVVWLVTRSLGPLMKVLDRNLVGLARLRVLVRPAAGYLSRERWRAGLTLAMFSMVVCILVASLTLIHVLLDAFAGKEPPVAGYDLRADIPGGAQIDDIASMLAMVPAISRETFGAIGSFSKYNAHVVSFSLSSARWQPTALVVVDDGFLGGIRARITQRTTGYRSDQSIWTALRERSGVAIITARGQQDILRPAEEQESEIFQPFTVWVRLSGKAQPLKLTIIGVVDARSELDSGVYISQATAEALHLSSSAPRSYFFAVQPGTYIRDAAQSLRISFGERALAVVELGELQQMAGAVRLLLMQLVQCFMGLGLIAGIAALGLLGIQAVIERRQQLGTLRALGLTRWETSAALALESAVVAAAGLGLGLLLGLILARSIIDLLAVEYPQVRYAIPFREILLVGLAAWLSSGFAISLSAWYAGRVAPAEALRGS